MGYSGTLQIFDRLAPEQVQKDSRGSWIGFIGTLMIIGLCLAVYVLPVISYFKGNYSQSQYTKDYNSSVSLYSGDDFKMVVVIKDQITGLPINHANLLKLLNVQVTSNNINGYNFQKMVNCNTSYFVGDINGEQLTDCMMIPDGIQYPSGFIPTGFGYISIYINAHVPSNPIFQPIQALSAEQFLYTNILDNCYIQLYFTSKVIASDTTVKFQVHRVATSHFDVGNQFISASFQVISGLRVTTMDDSILPWRNLRNITNMKWLGSVVLLQLYSSSSAISQGFQVGMVITNISQVAVRYYLKIDSLLGDIGGGMFLFYLIFAVVFNYINQMLLKMDLVNKLILKNKTDTTQNEYPVNDNDLQSITIPHSYVFQGWLPVCCQNQELVQIIEESEKLNDIVLLLKKQQVAIRNLTKLKMNPTFQQKILELQGNVEVNQESKPKFSKSQHINSQVRQNLQLIGSRVELNEIESSHINITSSSGNLGRSNQEEGIHQIVRVQNREVQSEKNVSPVKAIQEEVEQMQDIIVQEKPEQINNECFFQENMVGQVNNIAALSPQNVRQKKEITIEQNNNYDYFQYVAQNKEIVISQNNNSDELFQAYSLIQAKQGGRSVQSRTSNNNRNPRASQQLIQTLKIQNQGEDVQVIFDCNVDQPIFEQFDNSRIKLNQRVDVGQKVDINPVQDLQNAQIMPPLTQNVMQQPKITTDIFVNQPTARLQPQQIDDKFNLTSDQLEFIIKDRQLVPQYFENNQTVQVMRDQKSIDYPKIMNLLTYNKWNQPIIKKQKHTIKAKFFACLAYIGEGICKMIRKVDVFSARVDLIAQPHSSSCIGCCFTLLILSLSILTFFLTCANMSNLMYKFSYDYIAINNVQFSRVTDNNFNLLVCFTDPSYMLGSTKTANLNYFTYINGVTTTIQPIQMSANDNTINFNSNQMTWLKNPIPTSSCYKMPNNVPVILDQNSYFGYTITPFCTGTVSYCNTTQNVTYSNFVTARNNAFLWTVLPGSRFNDSSMSLGIDFYAYAYQTVDFVNVNGNFSLEETLEVEKIVLLDDTQFTFMRSAPTVKDTNIDLDLNTKRSNFKATPTLQPSYTFKIRPNQSQTTYTVFRNNIDDIIGIIGGVFVLWFLLFKLWGIAYNRFNFNSYLAKVIYEQQGYQNNIKKIIAAINCPDCLVLNCFGWRRDVSRMKRVNIKIERSIDHLSLLKYTHIYYYLSSCFFPKLQGKNLSLLHFRTLIDMNEQVVGPVESKPIRERRESDFENHDDVDESEQHETGRQIQKEQQGKQNILQGNLVQQSNTQNISTTFVEKQFDNIIPSQNKSFFWDIFEEPSSFTFKGQRYSSSVFGGICCLIMVALVAIIVNYQVGLYLTSGSKTVSYQTFIDDSITNPGSVKLLTGTNFRFGLVFINATTLSSYNITSYLNQIGISLLLQQFDRTNGIIVPSVKVVDLVPCPPGYLQQWLSPSSDPTYFTNIQYAYCIPDNMVLEISGIPESSILKTFKVSIYNAMGNSTGFTTLTQLLNTSFVQYYFSTPQQNSLNRTINYEIATMIFDYFPTKGAVIPVENNITFSKLNITYDDNAGTKSWITKPLNQIAYTFDPFSTSTSQYTFRGNPNTEAWYNLSFSYSKRMEVYYITTPYFFEVWGMVGGVLAVFLAICCIPKSFNTYRLRYLIGRQLYVLQRKKKKGHKNEMEKQLIRQMNNFNEWDILKAFFASYWGNFTGNYNFSDTLRKVTLIQTRIEKDMNLVEFYKNLSGVRDALIKQFSKNPELAKKKITDIFLKHINNPSPKDTSFPQDIRHKICQKISNYARRHKLSSYEQMIAQQALNSHININEIFNHSILAAIFNVNNSDGQSVRMSMGGSMGSLGSTSFVNTNSVGSRGEPSIEDQNP